MPKKKPTGFRIPKAVAEDLKAIAKAPPRRPIRCTTRRVANAHKCETDDLQRECSDPAGDQIRPK